MEFLSAIGLVAALLASIVTVVIGWSTFVRTVRDWWRRIRHVGHCEPPDDDDDIPPRRPFGF